MRKNVFKRVAAGLLSLLTVAVYTPANVADLITGMGGTTIVASAEEEDPHTHEVENPENITVTDEYYFIHTGDQFSPTMSVAEAEAEAGKDIYSNVVLSNIYVNEPVFSNSVYAKYTKGNETGAVLLANIKASDKVFDEQPYDPATLVEKTINSNLGYDLDTPIYYQITSVGENTYKLKRLGQTAPTAKGRYLISYTLSHNGSNMRDEYVYAPFTIGSGTVTDRVVTVDLNGDNKISANEVFGGFSKDAGRRFDTTALAEYAANNPDFNADAAFLNSLISDVDFADYDVFNFKSLGELTKLRYTGKEYKLNIYLYSTYTNGGVTKTQMVKAGEYTVDKNIETDIGTYNATITSQDFIVPENMQKLPWAITKKQLTDVLVAADGSQGGKIERGELYGDLVWNPDGGVLRIESQDGQGFLNDVAAWYRAKHPEVADVQADALFNELMNADFVKKAFRGETPTEAELGSTDQEKEAASHILETLRGKGAIAFKPLDALKEDFEFDEKPYELAVYPFSIMPSMDSTGYDLEMLKTTDYVVGGTLSNIAAGKYDIQIQSDVYDIASHVGGAGYSYDLSNESNVQTAVIKWNINVCYVRPTGDAEAVDFEVVPEDVETELDGVGNTPVNVLYTGQPVEIKDYFNDNKPTGLQEGDILFHINNNHIPDGVELEVKHYFKLAGDETATWKEGTPTQAGTYQVIGLYNGKVSAEKSTAINENYAFYTDEMTLVINQVDMTVQSTASSIYGDKLTVDMNKITIKNKDVDPEGKKISEIADVTAEVVLPNGTAKDAVLGARTYDLKLTIKAKEGYEEEFKNYKLKSGDNVLDKDGVLIVKDGYEVKKKSVTADMVEFASQYVKPEEGMVNYGDVTVKFDGYDVSGKTKEIVLEANHDYKLYGATQAASENEYKMSIRGLDPNYKDWDKVTWTVDKDDEVVITGKYARMLSTSYDAANKKLKFYARAAVPSEATMTKIGLIATKNPSIKYDLTVDTPQVTGETYVKEVVKNFTEKGTTFNWTKSQIEAGDVWYAVPYVCYTIGGKEVIKYGELTEVAAGGEIAPVELATVKFSKANYFRDTDNSWRIKFTNFCEVPEGCTVDKVGICATDMSELIEGMNKDTKHEGHFYNRSNNEIKDTSVNFSWTKKDVAVGGMWYLKPYVVYTDADGAENTVYGDICTVTAESQNIADGTGEVKITEGIAIRILN